MPYRFITDTFGKGKQKNIIKDFTEDNDISYKTYRFESSKNSSVFKSETFDVHKMLIEISDCGMLQSSNNGYSITIPRQRYNPLLVYVSFLKMAYSIMPREEYANIVKGIAAMRIALENENMSEELQEKLSDFSNKKYYNSQPNVGIELINIDNPLEKTVDVCLMKLKGYSEPRYLFGLQLKYYTIIIPIVSDSFEGGELKLTPVTNHNLIHIRKLDFSSVEEKLVASFDATKIEIPQELYRGLEKDLRNSNLLRKEK